MQGSQTVCIPLKYLMPDIQKAKCFELTVQICPPPSLGAPRGQTNLFLYSIYALDRIHISKVPAGIKFYFYYYMFKAFKVLFTYLSNFRVN